MGEKVYQEYFLGFSPRENVVEDASSWDEDRKMRFLSRMDVRMPLSVDANVWTEPIQWEDWMAMSRNDGSLKNLRIQRETQGVFENYNGLYDDPEVLRSFLNQARADVIANYCLIGVTLAVHSAQDVLDRCAGRVSPAPDLDPRLFDINPDWTRLGYDVADYFMLSGLTNCGYFHDEKNIDEMAEVEALRKKWSPLLNDHHLFNDIAAAEAFRDFSDARVEEHAPFYVYGIYKVEG